VRPGVSSTSGVISFPSGPIAFVILRVASMVATTIHTLASAKWRPGQILRLVSSCTLGKLWVRCSHLPTTKSELSYRERFTGSALQLWYVSIRIKNIRIPVRIFVMCHSKSICVYERTVHSDQFCSEPNIVRYAPCNESPLVRGLARKLLIGSN
jgi:hypothetical protein